jgi:hypothetical protein
MRKSRRIKQAEHVACMGTRLQDFGGKFRMNGTRRERQYSGE